MLFLDRDGVINVNHGYVHTPSQTDWVPGIFSLCRSAQAQGAAVVVVTNQAGIARGYYTEQQFADYSVWMHGRFADEGVLIAATFYCPHHPVAGQGIYRVDCGCRKPAPGMLEAAGQSHTIDWAGSLLVGDKYTDMQAGRAAAVGHCFLVGDRPGMHPGEMALPESTFIACSDPSAVQAML